MADSVAINMPEEMIKPIIEAKMQAAVAEALGGSQAILDSVISSVLRIKVDERGQPSNYHNSVPLLQWLCRDAITNAVRDALKTWADTNKAKIAASLEKHLRTNAATDAIVRAFLDGTVGAITRGWNFTVNVGPKD